MEFPKYRNPGQNKQIFVKNTKKWRPALRGLLLGQSARFLSVHTGLQSKTSSAVQKVESGIYVIR